jgi:hypothetical protein
MQLSCTFSRKRTLTAVLAALALSTAATGATLFTDGFEAGTLNRTAQNGVSWINSQATAVSNTQAASGQYSLRFTFAGVPRGEDSFAEQRIALPSRPAYWFRYKLYIPTNYAHRSDSYSNNKFLAVYQSPYLKENGGFQVNFSLQPNGSGGSNVEVHHYNNGSEGPVRWDVVRDFVSDADKGKWMDLIAEVRVPASATSSDGIMRLWKNGQQVVNITNLASWGGSGKNYIDQAYFLGWANSGFDQTTLLYIDDVQVSDTPISAGTVPNPPTNVTSQ